MFDLNSNICISTCAQKKNWEYIYAPSILAVVISGRMILKLKNIIFVIK